MNTRDWYFRQALKENEFDAAFSDVELAMWKIVKDLKLYGLAYGGETTEVSPLVYNVAEFLGYDQQGRRISPITPGGFSGLDITNDSLGNPNTPSAGNLRWVALVARHGYLKSDARTDGNAATVYFIRNETISSSGDDTIANAGQLQILQGAEGASPTKPTLTSDDDLVVADILLDDTGAAVAIEYSRQQQIPAFTIPSYNSLNSFYPGQIVLYQGSLYQSITTVPPGIGPTNKTYWRVHGRSGFLGSFNSEAQSFMNAQRQRVAGFDHWGFPSGKIVTVDENWLDTNLSVLTNTGIGPWKGPWRYRINNGGGFAGTGLWPGTQLSSPSTQPWGPCARFNVFGQSVDAAMSIEFQQGLIYMQGASFVMEWAFSIDDGGGSGFLESNTTLAMGINTDGTVVSGNSTDPISTGSAAYKGVFFRRLASAGTWSVLIDNGTTSSGTDTGVAVAVNVPHFAKIVILGATASDDGTARCLAFLDGSLVANQAIAMTNLNIYPFFRFSANQGEVVNLNIGPTRMHARVALNDEFGP